MADGDFFLVSKTGDAINLNPLLTSDAGVQAVAGLTGFGLPPVEVLYQVGAGDGAKFRGQRTLPRDIDLPLYISGASRQALRDQVQRLALALGDECSLQWDDGSQLWELKVRRVGGGEYVYGSDTQGQDLSLTITLRSESSLWSAVKESFVHYPVASDTTTRIALPSSALGSAPSRPLIRVSGPTYGFTIENESRTRRLQFNGLVPENDYIDVDMSTGRVTNSTGKNGYSYLAPGPAFFELSAAEPGVWVTLDRTSDAYVAVAGDPLAKNYITNPSFKTATTGWGLNAYTVNGGPGVIGYIKHDAEALLFQRQRWDAPTQAATTAMSHASWIVGAGVLTVGKRYQITVQITEMDGGYPEAYPMGGNHEGAVVFDNVGYQTSAPIRPFHPQPGRPLEIILDFVARSDQGAITIYPPAQHLGKFGGWQNARHQLQMRVGAVSLTDYGFGYFDGDTPDTAERSYQWTAAAHGSVSTVLSGGSTVPKPDLPKGAGVYIKTNAKNWLVV